MAERTHPEVDVEQGRLVGRWRPRSLPGRRSAEPVAVFRGVPFAAPPVGDRRWRPPAPAEPWSGARQATKDGPMAIQMATGIEEFLGGLLDGQGWRRPRAAVLQRLLTRLPQPAQSEDCLYLTVRSPSLDPAAKLPVMVWIHGGDHQDGSGTDVYYAANALPARGVVTVSINYRLGVLGFLAHPELLDESPDGVAGNYGLLDQVAALEWVRDNIAGFGGDPDNVTIFGESAGGESVLHLMTSPRARGLFHRAIPQSAGSGGQMIHLDRPFDARRSGTDLAVAYAEALGVTGDDQLPRLRAMSADRLYEVARAEREIGAHYAVIDGEVLPESPLAAFAGGRQAPVPMVIGSNADEGTLLRGVMGAPMVDYQHRPVPAGRLQPEIAEAFGTDLDRLLAIYPGLDRADTAAEIDFLGDHLFGARAYHYARHHHAAGHPTHLYLFARTPKSPRQTAGAFHAAEIPFVHGSRVPIFPMTAADKALSATMMGYWTGFARTGDPNGPDASTVGDRPVWSPFDQGDPRWMFFDHRPTMAPVDRLDQYEIFNARTDRLVAEMAGSTSG
ncbi:MAG: carboxylesterase family protein [Actinomycetota bacterium]